MWRKRGLETHLVCQSGCVVGDEMKVCLEEIQVAVMYILQRIICKLKVKELQTQIQ